MLIAPAPYTPKVWLIIAGMLPALAVLLALLLPVLLALLTGVGCTATEAVPPLFCIGLGAALSAPL